MNGHRIDQKRRLRHSILLSALLAAGVAGAPALSVAQTISTLGSLGTSQQGGTVGSGNTPTFGNLFIAQSTNPMQTMGFELQNNSGGTTNFQAFVYAWNGTTVTGLPLFASTVFTGPSSNQNTLASISGVGQPLVQGQTYVAFFTRAA